MEIMEEFEVYEDQDLLAGYLQVLKKTKKKTKAEKREEMIRRRASWIRNIIARGNVPQSLFDSMVLCESSWNGKRGWSGEVGQAISYMSPGIIFAEGAPGAVLWSMLVADDWDDLGPNIRVTQDGGTALHLLAQVQPDDHTIWQAVLDSGVDLDALDNNGRTWRYFADSDFHDMMEGYANARKQPATETCL